jgi:hypothetical protein
MLFEIADVSGVKGNTEQLSLNAWTPEISIEEAVDNLNKTFEGDVDVTIGTTVRVTIAQIINGIANCRK